MIDRPIIFSGTMVRALLDGRKTMTRRLAWQARREIRKGSGVFRCPASPWQKVQPGDRLYVREAFSYSWSVKDDPERRHLMPIWFWADGNPEDGDWSKPRPSIHMPRWASRLTLIVTATKIERLQEISEQEALLEGILHQNVIVDTHGSTGVHCEITADRFWNCTEDDSFEGHDSAGEAFEDLWIRLHGAGAWDANPEVVVLTFRVIRANIDSPEALAA